MWTPNWGRLFAEGRCKAIWVPFSNEELTAISEWVNAKDIQSWKWKVAIVEETTETEEVIETETEEVPILIADEKEIKKQLKQTLRDKGISFTNFDTIEKLQAKLTAN